VILETILTGIKTWFDDSPLPALTEGLFYGQADRDTDAPYVTYHLIDGRTDDDMSSYVQDMLVQFSVWSDDSSPTEAVRIGEMLALWFDDAAIDVDGGACYICQRESYNLVQDPDVVGGGWQYQVDYRLMVQEV